MKSDFTKHNPSLGGQSGMILLLFFSLWLYVPTGTWPASLQLSVLRAFPQLLIEGLSLPAIA